MRDQIGGRAARRRTISVSAVSGIAPGQIEVFTCYLIIDFIRAVANRAAIGMFLLLDPTGTAHTWLQPALARLLRRAPLCRLWGVPPWPHRGPPRIAQLLIWIQTPRRGVQGHAIHHPHWDRARAMVRRHSSRRRRDEWVVIRSHRDAELRARAMINTWLKKHSTQKLKSN
jgi:hypothetical protein